MDSKEISAQIINGDFDDDLGALEQAISARKQGLTALSAAMTKASLKSGTTVQIKLNAPLSPKYILGIPLKVKKVNKTTATCDVIDPELLPSRRFAAGLRVPLEHIEIA